jgi:hypothetical protein
MKTIQELLMKKEIAPDLQASWGDKKNILNVDDSFAYLKAIASEKGIQLFKNKTGYLVCQWSMAKHVKTKDELVKFLKFLGVNVC